MVEANIKIIEDLKEVLSIINSNSEVKQLFTESEKDFTRDRKLTFNRTVLLIVNMLKRSLSIEVREFFENCIDEPINCTKAALTIQRKKIKSFFFEVWNIQFVHSFYEYYGSNVKKWKGFLIIAVDGSTTTLFNKESVIEHFGCTKNQYGETPLARIMKFYDVLNNFVVFSKICSIKIGEQTIVENNIEALPENSLSIYDRGFPSFSLMYLLINQEHTRHFVMRSKADFNLQVKEFMSSESTDTIKYFNPNNDTKKKIYQHGYQMFKNTNIKVRMVKVKLDSGETEVLLTNLYDNIKYETSCFKELYFLRWGMETSYDGDKNKQQIEQFSGHSVWSIEQDFYTTIFVSNLQSIIEKQSEKYLKTLNQTRKLNYKINKNVSIGSMKNKIVNLFFAQNPETILLHLQKLFEQNLEPIRKNRTYVRITNKPKPRGKFRTLTNYKRAI
jgi:hypothetical protein